MTESSGRRPLTARHTLAVLGIITGLAGVGLDDRRVTGIAIVLLGAAAVLRLIAARRSRAETVSEAPPAD